MPKKQITTDLTPELLDEMLENDFRTYVQPIKTVYDETNQKSPVRMLHEKINELPVLLSQPLKRMHSLYLSRSAKCYSEKHISDEWTNLEQIKLCKAKVYDKLFGDYEEAVHTSRTRDLHKYQE